MLATGASSGIGRATAIALAARGAAVWLDVCQRRAGRGGRLPSTAADVRVSQLDLRSPDGIEELWAEIGERWGSVHAVVNNGAVCPYRRFDEIELDEWDEFLETNAPRGRS